MLLHLLYILAFTVLAFAAIINLIRSLLTLGLESQRLSTPSWSGVSSKRPAPSHPELLDNRGKVIKEPLLVMRSVDEDEIRDRLDALYKASPGSPQDSGYEEQ